MKLYDYLPSGNGYKVRLLLAHLGADFEWEPVDILRGQSRTAEFLRLNPNGRIPLLALEDGSCLAESNAILCYLAEGTPWWPADRRTRAAVMQWLFFEQYSHEPNIATARFWLAIRGTPLSALEQELLAQKQRAGRDALRQMEERLGAGDWLAGDAPSIGDIALYAYTHVAGEGGFDLEPFGRLRAWLDRMRALPGHVPIEASPPYRPVQLA